MKQLLIKRTTQTKNQMYKIMMMIIIVLIMKMIKETLMKRITQQIIQDTIHQAVIFLKQKSCHHFIIILMIVLSMEICICYNNSHKFSYTGLLRGLYYDTCQSNVSLGMQTYVSQYIHNDSIASFKIFSTSSLS